MFKNENTVTYEYEIIYILYKLFFLGIGQNHPRISIIKRRGMFDNSSRYRPFT